MSKITRLYNSSMSSVQALEDRCNFDELNLPGKLESLSAVHDTVGVKVTKAIYEEIEESEGVGNLKIAQDAAGKHSAWILTVATKITFSRPDGEKKKEEKEDK